MCLSLVVLCVALAMADAAPQHNFQFPHVNHFGLDSVEYQEILAKHNERRVEFGWETFPCGSCHPPNALDAMVLLAANRALKLANIPCLRVDVQVFMHSSPNVKSRGTYSFELITAYPERETIKAATNFKFSNQIRARLEGYFEGVVVNTTTRTAKVCVTRGYHLMDDDPGDNFQQFFHNRIPTDDGFAYVHP